MLLSQNMFGPLPPSPQSSSPDETDGFPPLPPSPLECATDKFDEVIVTDAHTFRTPSLTKSNRYRDSIDHAPVIPPHRCTPTLNTLKTRFVYLTSTSIAHNRNQSKSFQIVSDRWMLVSRNATKITMFRCHRMHQAHYRKSIPVHAIREGALCLAHFPNARHRVHAKNDVCKLHAVYRRRQYSPEGKNSRLHKLQLK